LGVNPIFGYFYVIAHNDRERGRRNVRPPISPSKKILAIDKLGMKNAAGKIYFESSLNTILYK